MRVLVVNSKGKLVKKAKKVIPVIKGTRKDLRRWDTTGMTKKFLRRSTKNWMLSGRKVWRHRNSRKKIRKHKSPPRKNPPGKSQETEKSVRKKVTLTTVWPPPLFLLILLVQRCFPATLSVQRAENPLSNLPFHHAAVVSIQPSPAKSPRNHHPICRRRCSDTTHSELSTKNPRPYLPIHQIIIATPTNSCIMVLLSESSSPLRKCCFHATHYIINHYYYIILLLWTLRIYRL